MTKNNFYVITGGPGGGKTSLLENLASKGYKFIPETARQIIRERISAGLAPRPDALSFAQEIFRTDCHNFNEHSDYSSVLFFDRSFVDSAWQLFCSNQDEYNKIKDTYLKIRYNNKVFITPPWKEIYQNDSERDQTYEDSIVVYERLRQWYLEHGYEVIVLPKDTIENRVKFILSQLPI